MRRCMKVRQWEHQCHSWHPDDHYVPWLMSTCIKSSLRTPRCPAKQHHYGSIVIKVQLKSGLGVAHVGGRQETTLIMLLGEQVAALHHYCLCRPHMELNLATSPQTPVSGVGGYWHTSHWTTNNNCHQQQLEMMRRTLTTDLWPLHKQAAHIIKDNKLKLAACD